MDTWLNNLWHGVTLGGNEVMRSLMVALLSLVIMLVVVLVVIWLERKVSADIQNRIGPIRTGGVLGFVLQSLADALKLLMKEDLRPAGADRWPFYIAPYLVFLPAFMAYMILPFSATWIPQDVKIGILYYCAVSAVPVLGIAIAGWASNNKWSLLGALRSAAQLVSYEIPLGLAILAAVLLHGTLETGAIVRSQWLNPWLTLLTLPALLIFLTAGLAEVSRTPFDLPEAESELVSGFNTEYSGMRFATFFLAEFSASFFISALAVTLFLGGWSLWGLDLAWARHVFHWDTAAWFVDGALVPAAIPFVMKAFWFAVFMVKTFVVLWILMWVKWTLPRLRIDQVLNFGWKALLPAALANLLLVSLVGAWLQPAGGDTPGRPAVVNAIVLPGVGPPGAADGDAAGSPASAPGRP
ncbi:MAG TPA: NADH-quinone oxidoreductase subunit NuoH [Armatimonadota bacterium]|nr:NADH-quinone oxidoreductase subunit NuoH [Armatimonadota bacterium]